MLSPMDLDAIRPSVGLTDGAWAVRFILSRPLADDGLTATEERFLALSWSLWTTVRAREWRG